MTAEEALYNYFNSFGITAYPSGSVPETTTYPWLVYDVSEGNWGDSSTISGTINLWYHTESEKVPNEKADEIREALGRGGVVIPFTGGALWIKRGEPWCVKIIDDADASIKRRQLNIEVEYWQE